MEFLFGALLVILSHDGVYSEYVEVYGNTFTRILNQNYTEDVVAVRSKLECTKLCIITKSCEAILYNKTADDSRCILRKYITPNILYPLVIESSLPGSTSVMFLRNHEVMWTVRNDYTYNSTLKFWYRAVINPKANAADANDACKSDGAFLMLIRHQADYDFVINLQHQLGEVRMYLQGTRQVESDGFVDELGQPLPFYHWDVDGINGGGLYLRTNSDNDMETSAVMWTVRNDYTYNSTLKFWYRAVINQKANVADANDACKSDGAFLMLIRHQADYDFVINLQHQLGEVRMYLQGTRQVESDGFVDELGQPLPFYHWDVDGINGGGLYLRTNSDYDMETSAGDQYYNYICQVLLN